MQNAIYKQKIDSIKPITCHGTSTVIVFRV